MVIREMTWTSEPPQKPGWYWKKSIWNLGTRNEMHYIEIVHLNDYDIYPVRMKRDILWAGPIQELEE